MNAIEDFQHTLVKQARDRGEYGGAVLEGRDLGTVVFPEADVKFFLQADPKERARRRYEQLRQKDPSVIYGDVWESLKQRDLRDTTREIAPLKAAEDAIHIDSSDLSIEEVISTMEESIND